jgi:hypothetical protein
MRAFVAPRVWQPFVRMLALTTCAETADDEADGVGAVSGVAGALAGGSFGPHAAAAAAA